MTDAHEDQAPVMIALGLFWTIFLLSLVDVVMDHLAGPGLAHLTVEGLIVVLAAVGVGALVRQVRLTRREARALQQALVSTRSAADHWRQEAQDVLAGLGMAINRQFDRWHLTRAEREIGLLLLKGLSHKEIAVVRGVHERTVRQQSLTLYRKGNLTGRAHLSAYFLEDLLLPGMADKTQAETRHVLQPS